MGIERAPPIADAAPTGGDRMLTPFQRAVVDAVEALRPGDLVTDGDLAEELGRPGSAAGRRQRVAFRSRPSLVAGAACGWSALPHPCTQRKAPSSSRRDTRSATTAACAPAAVVDRAAEPGWTLSRRGRGEHMSWLAAILARFDEALEWPEETMFDAALDWPVEPQCELPGGA